jgi:hypothetical protein
MSSMSLAGEQVGLFFNDDLILIESLDIRLMNCCLRDLIKIMDALLLGLV